MSGCGDTALGRIECRPDDSSRRPTEYILETVPAECVVGRFERDSQEYRTGNFPKNRKL